MSDTVHRFSHEAMTTTFEVCIAGQQQEYARQASGAVFSEIDRIDGLLNKYDAGSDVGQINLLEAGGSVRIGIETIECLEHAAWAYQVSGGLFDPTLGSGYRWLNVDKAGFSVGWDAAGKGELDLGGIGKGYAIDKAAEVLADWDVTEALINGGNSTVLALGREWELGVGGPWGEKAGQSKVTLKNQALSGSGTEVKGEHIVNPLTGAPAERHLAAWAIHSSAARSDALSTAFMMMTPAEIKSLCGRDPLIVAFVVEKNEHLLRIGF
jgi:thiamine biosynthesis lipoprotein